LVTIFSFLRNELSRRTLERVKNFDDDDLFLSFDADEIPNSEVKSFFIADQNLDSKFSLIDLRIKHNFKF